MKKKLALQTAILNIVIFSTSFGQNGISNAVFVDVNIGSYVPIFPLDESRSKSGITYRGGIGIQLFQDYIITGRIMYFSIHGVPLVRYSIGEGNYLAYDGDMEYKHWLSMIALQYRLAHEGNFSASISGGILFLTATKTEISIKYDYFSESKINNVVGGFLGGEIEWMVSLLPFSVMGDVQLYYSIGDKENYGSGSTAVFSGFNASIGFRYYIQI